MKVEHKVLKIINDPHYLEHDAYFLFDSIMINMWEWYYVSDVRSNNSIMPNRFGHQIQVDAEQRLFSRDRFFPGGE
jgi:hypothetical protein